MQKLKAWALDFWAAILKDEEARAAVKRIEQDAALVLRAARESLTTGRMLSLVAAVGAAAKESQDAGRE